MKHGLKIPTECGERKARKAYKMCKLAPGVKYIYVYEKNKESCDVLKMSNTFFVSRKLLK